MPAITRRRIDIEGIVQGVGFRPFVYQCAIRCGLAGWVLNDSRGVSIEVEGSQEKVEVFTAEVRAKYPPLATISRFETADCPPKGEDGFVIRPSEEVADARAQVSPDTFVCPDCLEELLDPADRRYRYPFINCTNCGPRYTIVTGIPYDRPLTTMADFPMCSECQAEYDDPGSRRFHAQPNACPACGPRLALCDAKGMDVAGDPVAQSVALLRAGKIIAVKGLGGYHLAVDACNEAAVAELRRRKARDEKPFALMCNDLESARAIAHISDVEARLLEGPERPIVLLEKRPHTRIAAAVAPRNRYLGVMLAYTPLHFLLLEDFSALVMTSANLTDEPICYQDADARQRLGGIADAYLSHDRRIHVRADDSIARVMAGEALLIRRSRGYVPRSLLLGQEKPPVLAVGAELKNSFCLTRGDRAYLSQHIGDLKNLSVAKALRDGVAHFSKLLEVEPVLVAHDLHPDYASTAFAEALGDVPRLAVQHHHAHLVSCLAENRRTGPAIGVIFDGIGLGPDGSVWGGEFLVGDERGFVRRGHLRTLRMPGGDAATREPYRMALAWLWEAGLDRRLPEALRVIPEAELKLLRQVWERGINSPLTSSCGRLFDAVAALCGLRRKVSFEGQAALELEMAIAAGPDPAYPMRVVAEGEKLLLDWQPLLEALLNDLERETGVGTISRRFHEGLASGVVEVCSLLRGQTGLGLVALSGGVFQNRYLTETLSAGLAGAGFEVCRHSLVPPNDGGLALGQAVIAAASL